MRVGNWVPLYRKIVPIPQRLAMAFGLAEGSQLHLAPLRDPESRHRFDYEIIVSPIPIQSWNSVCRLSVRLRDEPGSLAVATRFLRDHRINILLTESCSTYKDRAHWDAICDIAGVTGFSVLRDVSSSYYEQAMQRFLQTLTDALHCFIARPENSRFFLAGPELHAVFTPLTGLNDSSFYADFTRTTTLQYRAGGIQISESLAHHIVTACRLDTLPSYAMITGNTEQRYLRIYFIRDHHKMFRAVIRNELTGLPGGGVGVLNQFLRALPQEINIIRLSNYIIEKDGETEKGQIEMIGHWDIPEVHAKKEPVDGYMKRELDRVLREVDLEDVEGGHHGPLLKLVDLSPPEVLYPRVFISHSTDYEQEKLQLLINRLWDNHFEPVIGTDFEQDFSRESDTEADDMMGESIVHTTLKKVSTCVALVSLQVKRPDFRTKPTSKNQQDRYIVPPWTIAEEVFAWSKKIEFFRIKDKAVEDPKWSRDVFSLEFDSDQSYAEAVERAVERLNAFRQGPKFAAAKQRAREALFRKTYVPSD